MTQPCVGHQYTKLFSSSRYADAVGKLGAVLAGELLVVEMADPLAGQHIDSAAGSA